jgi:hypothetical protein
MWALMLVVVAPVAASGTLTLRVGDRGARSPMPIDPFVRQGPKLVAIGSGEGDVQGASVALSSDGNTALVGSPGPEGSVGATYVLIRSRRPWRQQAKLVGAGAVGGAEQGKSVALSGDGNTALVDGPADNSGVGAVWVFARSRGTWRQQAKLTGIGAPSTPVPCVVIGLCPPPRHDAVALSRDGKTAVVDGIDHVTGAAWVFTRSGATWRRQAKLAGIGAASSIYPWGVALSDRGNTALVGRPDDNSGAGAVWVFTRSNATWSRRAKLVGSAAVGRASQGRDVALSGDGNTALIGGPSDNLATGAAWVFVRSRQTWRQQGSKFVGAGGTGPRGASQGWSVALSSDGDTALVGGPDDNNFAGAAWLFMRSRRKWAQERAKLTGSSGIAGAEQGWSVALSGDGNTALLGGPDDNVGTGAVWVFVRVPALSVSLAASHNERG